jgi:hypothetical protein
VAVRAGSDLRTVVLRLRDVVLGAPQTGHSAAAVEIVLALAPLWRGEARVEEIRLVRPLLRIGAAPDQAAGEPAGGLLGGSSIPALFRDGPLVILDGVVAATDGPSRLTLTALDGRVVPEDGIVHLEARATLDAGAVHVSGSIPTTSGAELALTIDATAIPLAAVAWLRNHLTGTADLRVRVGGPASAPRVRGTLLVRAGRLIDMNPIAAIVGDTPAAAVLATVAPELASAELPFDELRAAFVAAGERLRAPRVHLARHGVTVAGTLRVGSAQGVHGGGAVRMPAPITDALLARMPALASQREPAGTMILPFAVTGSIEAPRFIRRF